MGKLEVEESGKVLEQCKWMDIYQEDLEPDVRPRKPMFMGGEDSSGWGKEYQKFEADSLPEGIVQEAQVEIQKIVEEELRVQVQPLSAKGIHLKVLKVHIN